MKTKYEILEECAKCCSNSAFMLSVCDEDKPKLAHYNRKQAELLWECAERLCELAEDVR
jgi:HEPN domain-containing protein